MKRILSGLLGNKGVTLITLIIAITIFSVFITVFSYIMIAKHESEPLYVQSTQAYAVAQAGIEYSIRYATDNESNFFANPASVFPVPGTPQSFGNGSFTLGYDSVKDELTSTGTVGTAERQIIYSKFKSVVLCQPITLDPTDPPHEP